MRGSVGNSGKSKGTVENYCPFWFLGGIVSSVLFLQKKHHIF